MKRALFLSLIVSLALVTSGCFGGMGNLDDLFGGSSQHGSLSGTAKDAKTDQPIEGVTITVDAKTAVSDASGAWRIDDIETGAQTLSAVKQGYADLSESITVENGENTHEITLTPAVALPTQGKLSYVANNEIWVMNWDGSGAMKLADTSRNDRPGWSSDGSKVAFACDPENPDSWARSICSVDADGNGFKHIKDYYPFIKEPAWSPDGTKLAVSLQTEINVGDAIFVIDADTGTETRTSASVSSLSATNPDWSPDGSTIIYVEDGGSHSSIKRVQADGSTSQWGEETTLLSAGRYGDDFSKIFSAVWSPDGSQIAFDAIESGGYGIYVMNADGSSPTLISDPSLPDPVWSPNWSPDGKKLVFVSSGDIFVIDADGSNQVQITDTDITEGHPVWVP